MQILKSCALVLAVSLLPYGVCAEFSSPQEETSRHQWREIDMQELETLLNSNTSFSLVDARSDKYFDGTLIRGAKRLPAESDQVTIESSLPNKNELIVVYCAGGKCPASKNLAKRLVGLGYTNVADYHGGMQDWIGNGKPTQNTKN